MRDAVISNDAAKVKEILATSDYLSNNEFSAFLMLAVELGHDIIVKELLALPSVDVNVKNFHGNTALMCAITNAPVNIVKELLDALGIDDSDRKKQIKNGIRLASMSKYIAVIRHLLKDSRIDLNVRNTCGYTALMYATSKGHTLVVSLLESRLNINDIILVKNDFGQTAFSVATKNVVKYLIYSGKVLLKDNNLIAYTSAMKSLNHLTISMDNYSGSIFMLKLKDMLDSLEFVSFPDKYEMVSKNYNGRLSILSLDTPLIMYTLNYSIYWIKYRFSIRGLFCNILGRFTHSYSNSSPATKNTNKFPHRINLLAARICGISFSDPIITLHSGMSMSKFKWVSSLMRNAKLTKLVYGFNDYMFMHMLLLRDNIGSYLDRIPFEIKIEIVSFISVKDLSVDIKYLPPIAEVLLHPKRSPASYFRI